MLGKLPSGGQHRAGLDQLPTSLSGPERGLCATLGPGLTIPGALGLASSTLLQSLPLHRSFVKCRRPLVTLPDAGRRHGVPR